MKKIILLILLYLIIFSPNICAETDVLIPAKLIEIKKNIATVKILCDEIGGTYRRTFKIPINTLFGTDLSKRPRKRAMSEFNDSYPNQTHYHERKSYPKLPSVMVKMKAKGDCIHVREYYSGESSWIFNSRDGKIYREMARILVVIKADYTNWLRKRSRYYDAKRRK